MNRRSIPTDRERVERDGFRQRRQRCAERRLRAGLALRRPLVGRDPRTARPGDHGASVVRGPARPEWWATKNRGTGGARPGLVRPVRQPLAATVRGGASWQWRGVQRRGMVPPFVWADFFSSHTLTGNNRASSRTLHQHGPRRSPRGRDWWRLWRPPTTGPSRGTGVEPVVPPTHGPCHEE